MENFTPIAALMGGALIGMSAVLLMLLNGRIAGVSGITAGLLDKVGSSRDLGWRVAFVAGLIAAPLLSSEFDVSAPDISFVTSWPTMIIAGLLVGFGTVLGNGCTSGHGVYGIARISLRSILATLIFLSAAIATVFVSRHLIGV